MLCSGENPGKMKQPLPGPIARSSFSPPLLLAHPPKCVNFSEKVNEKNFVTRGHGMLPFGFFPFRGREWRSLYLPRESHRMENKNKD
jgi:hypothetical protein